VLSTIWDTASIRNRQGVISGSFTARMTTGRGSTSISSSTSSATHSNLDVRRTVGVFLYQLPAGDQQQGRHGDPAISRAGTSSRRRRAGRGDHPRPPRLYLPRGSPVSTTISDAGSSILSISSTLRRFTGFDAFSGPAFPTNTCAAANVALNARRNATIWRVTNTRSPIQSPVLPRSVW
jgi:hypothetical protein